MHMREMIQQTLEQGFTGLGSLSFMLGEELKLLIQNGEIRELLLKNKNQKSRLPVEKYDDPEWFESSRMGYLNLQKASGRFLLCERACFETPARETRKSVQNSEVEKLFHSLGKLESATIVSLQWNRAQAYVLVPGSNIPTLRAVFLCGDYIDEDDSALSVMAYWDEPRCDIALYQGGLETDAWIALHLNILFEYFCSHLLNQYGYMTGRVMVNSMVRNLSFAASQFGCELIAAYSQVQDQTLFTSLEAAVSAYQSLLQTLDSQMEAVIGSGFIKVVKNQSLEMLNPFYINLARFYGFIPNLGK
jgi:hypothetical protein